MTATHFAIGYLTVTAAVSLVTFAAYGIDKRNAVLQRRRIPEKRLHQLALLGGWPGAWIGQQFFRHKTQKTRFRIVFWLTVVLHVGLIIAAVWQWLR
jgi:uncharacterized membrane protein YsdA (DUF1294 family)